MSKPAPASLPASEIWNPDQTLQQRAVAAATRAGMPEGVTKKKGQVQDHTRIKEVVHYGIIEPPPKDISKDDRERLERARSRLSEMMQSDSKKFMGVIAQLFLKLTALAGGLVPGSHGCLIPAAELFLRSLLRKPVAETMNVVQGCLANEARDTKMQVNAVVNYFVLIAGKKVESEMATLVAVLPIMEMAAEGKIKGLPEELRVKAAKFVATVREKVKREPQYDERRWVPVPDENFQPVKAKAQWYCFRCKKCEEVFKSKVEGPSSHKKVSRRTCNAPKPPKPSCFVRITEEEFNTAHKSASEAAAAAEALAALRAASA